MDRIQSVTDFSNAAVSFTFILFRVKQINTFSWKQLKIFVWQTIGSTSCYNIDLFAYLHITFVLFRDSKPLKTRWSASYKVRVL